MIVKQAKKNVLLFLILLGLISLLSDFTHEGARSIYGPYLSLIGVSAFAIAFTSGLGEFIGQALRIITGVIADKTKRYWTMMIVGYAINLLVIPLLMFVEANVWQIAIILILLERVGKGIRAPAKSALTSFTTQQLGVGKAFALQEVMDQIGAFLGPLFVYLILNLNQGGELDGYRLAFGLLGIFAIMTLVILVIAKVKYPNPDQFETKTVSVGFKGNKAFVLYMIAVVFLALGFIDYPVLAYHIDATSMVDVIYIPLIYSLVMGVDAIAALVFGILYDKKGVLSLIISTGISILIAPLFFMLDGVVGLVSALFFWGVAMGAQESVLKAVLASLVSKDKRATAYGIFYAVFGGAWFVGSLIVGALYEVNVTALVLFASLSQLISMIILCVYHQYEAKKVKN